MFQDLTVAELEDGSECLVQVAETEDLPDRHELDTKWGTVKIPADASPPGAPIEWEFEELRSARCALGLWDECGPFDIPDRDDVVPISVAAAGKAYLAAFLYLQLGERGVASRQAVADELDVSPETVRNHLSRVRIGFS